DNGIQGLLTDRQDLALKSILVGNLGAAGDDRLTDPRHRLDDPSAKPGRVGRHIAPADQRLPFGTNKVLDMLYGDGTRPLLLRQKAHSDGIASGRRQSQALSVRPIAQQRVGHLDQTAGPVADERVGSDRAAMVEIDQDLQSARDDIVRFSSLDIGDETDTARIMLVARVVETLSLGQCHRRCSSPGFVDTKLPGAPPSDGANAIIRTRLARTRIALTPG